MNAAPRRPPAHERQARAAGAIATGACRADKAGSRRAPGLTITPAGDAAQLLTPTHDRTAHRAHGNRLRAEPPDLPVTVYPD